MFRALFDDIDWSAFGASLLLIVWVAVAAFVATLTYAGCSALIRWLT